MGKDLNRQIAAAVDLGLTPLTQDAIRKGIIQLKGDSIVYHIKEEKNTKSLTPKKR